MERSSLDQAVSLLTSAARGVLIAVPAETSTDALASALGLALALDILGKSTQVVSPSFVPPDVQFLPGSSQVRERIEETPELRLTVPLGTAHVKNVAWSVEDQTLNITIQSMGDQVFPDAPVGIHRQGYPWDVIVTVGADRLHALGATFTEHAPFFYATPVLNLDRGPANEFFGAVNLVSVTAATVAEVTLDLLNTLGGVHLLSSEVATCLLTGIVVGSQSFRAPTTTPRTFQAASQLLEQDADHQEVIRHVFRTHTLGEVRLLGRALARLEELAPSVLITRLRHHDLAETDREAETLPLLFAELMDWTDTTRATLLVFERTPEQTEALLYPGKMSVDDRETLRERVQGTVVGAFILLNLGKTRLESAPAALRERVLPHLMPRGEQLAAQPIESAIR